MKDETIAEHSNRDKIIAAFEQSPDYEFEIIELPELGVSVEVRSMSAPDFGRITRGAVRRNPETGEVEDMDYTRVYADIIIATCFIPGENRKLFDNTHREMLARKNISLTRKLADTGMRISGFFKKGEELAKKDSSPSPSPSG